MIVIVIFDTLLSLLPILNELKRTLWDIYVFGKPIPWVHMKCNNLITLIKNIFMAQMTPGTVSLFVAKFLLLKISQNYEIKSKTKSSFLMT